MALLPQREFTHVTHSSRRRTKKIKSLTFDFHGEIAGLSYPTVGLVGPCLPQPAAPEGQIAMAARPAGSLGIDPVMPPSRLDVPPARIRVLRSDPPRRPARYVLYWMIAARRLEDNFGLQQAAWWARELDLPLLVFEPLRVGYPWASDRLHAFVLQGMAEHRAAAAGAGRDVLRRTSSRRPAPARACSRASRRTRPSS